MYYLALTGKVLLTPDLAEGTGNEDSKQARPATKGLAAPTLEVSGPDWLLHDVIAFFSFGFQAWDPGGDFPYQRHTPGPGAPKHMTWLGLMVLKQCLLNKQTNNGLWSPASLGP